MNFTNPLGSITAILAVLSPILASVFGCVEDANAAFGAKCTATFLTPTMMMWVTGAFAATVIISKAIRPGGWLHSFFGTTAVQVPAEKAGPGTVTKAQVQAPK